MNDQPCTIQLLKNGEQLVARRADETESVPARIVWASPMRAPAGGLSILHATKKKELAFVPDLEALEADSRALAVEELTRRYFLPKVLRIVQTRATFGNRYWHVETDRGPRRFLMKAPETNAIWLTDDRCVLRDCLGNCYEIESMAALDAKSRARADAVLLPRRRGLAPKFRQSRNKGACTRRSVPTGSTRRPLEQRGQAPRGCATAEPVPFHGSRYSDRRMPALARPLWAFSPGISP